MLIAFIHPGKAFLPDLEAYQNFFHKNGIETIVLQGQQSATMKVDVEWHFMGKNLKRRFDNSLLIHEYASASVPPFAGLKNRLKKQINTRPDYRIFQNSAIARSFDFHDDIPFGYRDMGVDFTVFSPQPSAKEFDFIFCGTITPDMKFEKLLNAFSSGTLSGKSLLVVSKNYETIQRKYEAYRNILFLGPVAQSDVSELINKSRFGINYKPLTAPYDEQTSTKVLEYLACNVPVVTTPTTWIKNFSASHGSKMFYLPDDFNFLIPEEVANFNYSFPDLSAFSWEKQIVNSGVMELINSTLHSHAGIVPKISS